MDINKELLEYKASCRVLEKELTRCRVDMDDKYQKKLDDAEYQNQYLLTKLLEYREKNEHLADLTEELTKHIHSLAGDN